MKRDKAGKRPAAALLLAALLAGAGLPALAHEPILKCVLLDERTVRCRGGYGHGEDAPGAAVEVIGDDDRTILAGKLDRHSTLTFPRPEGGFYVLFDAGPGHQAAVEHDEIGAPPAGDGRTRWMRR